MKLKELFARAGERIKVFCERQGAFRVFGVVFSALAVILVVVLLAITTEVRSVKIRADMSFYNESRIIEAAGVGEGDRMFGISSVLISHNIKKELPMVKSVAVHRSIFGNLYIKLNYRDYQYFYKYDGGFCGIDGDLVAKDLRGSSREYMVHGAVYVTLPATQSPRVNERVIFSESVYETEKGETYPEWYREAEYFDYVSSFLTRLARSEYFERTNAVFVDEKFNITMIYDGKYKILFGSTGDVDIKLSDLSEIVSAESLQYAEKAIIDLTLTGKPSARVDNSLDFSEYLLEDETLPETESGSELEAESETAEAKG